MAPAKEAHQRRVDVRLPASLVDRIEAEAEKDRRSGIRDELLVLLEEALDAREKRS